MKTYTEEFKKTIVEIYETGNKTKSELAREYGTSECNVRSWIKKYGKIKESINFKPVSVPIMNFGTQEEKNIF